LGERTPEANAPLQTLNLRISYYIVRKGCDSLGNRQLSSVV